MRQLLYVSTSNHLMSQEDLKELLKTCIKGNTAHHVTGVLTYVYNRFIQCIEGKQEDIEQLITNIRKDERNKSVSVLRDIEIKDRAFNGWSMGYVKYDNDTMVINDAFFKISNLNDLKQIKGLDDELFTLMANFYRSS